MGRLSLIPQIEARIGKSLKEYFPDAVKRAISPEQIATELVISKSLAYEFIKDYGVKEALKEARRKAVRSGVIAGELRKRIDEYIAEKKRAGMSPVTLKKDEETWRLYLWYLDYKAIPADLEHGLALDPLNSFFSYITTETNRFGKQFKKVAGQRTLKNYSKRMKAFYHWLQLMEYISDEPKADITRKMMKIKVPKRLPEDMSDETIRKVLNSFGDSFTDIRNKTIVEWFLETGMRLGEEEGGVTHLKINQFDWEKGTGRIVEKGDKQRTIVMSDKLREQVNKYIKVREPIAKTDYLWITEKGEALAGQGIQKMCSELNDIPGIKEDIARLNPGDRFHAHLFRRLWTKHLAQSEVPAFAMMIMGGWEDLELVQHYASAYGQEKAWSYINKASPLSTMV